MRKLFTALAVIFVLGMSTFALLSTPRVQVAMIPLVFKLLAPKDPFHESQMGDAPDYARTKYWAGLPQLEDAADLVPEDTKYRDNQGDTRADVFFIHGTGFVSRTRWTSQITLGSRTEENTDFSMANEASIFNSCCDVYVPRYRQASLFSYMSSSGKYRDRILAAVYQDIESAFDYFISEFNKGRPFIIASHSQGTHHALRLIESRIDGQPASQRLVAAYVLGSTMISVSPAYLNNLSEIHTCQHAEDTGCIVHWDAFQRGGIHKIFSSPEPSLCTNPLSWLTDESLVDKSHHMGAAPISGSYSVGLFGKDVAKGVVFDRLEAPMKNYTSAKCESGTLYVDDQRGTKYSELGQSPDGSVHGVDFAIFHIDIRENSIRRVNAYFEQH